MLVQYLILILLAYLMGSSNMAYYLSRAKQVDIRKNGSGNLGASNATVLFGWGAGVAVALHDIGKAVLAVLMAKWLFPQLTIAWCLAGLGAVIGHVFPFYMHFRGGKGFAPFAGLILALDWKFFLGIVALVILITLITDYIALGTLTTAVSFPAWFAAHGHIFPAVIVCIASAVIIYKHLINIRRMLNGTEIGLRRANRHDAPK